MKNWPWKLYSVFFAVMTVSGLRDIFLKDSPFVLYYTILIAFHKSYIVFLILNIASLMINVLVNVVVWCYAYQVSGSVKFWRVFFFVRIFFDLLGHHYDWQYIKSAFVQSFPYGLAAVGVFILPLVPSYLAHYFYAFNRGQRPIRKADLVEK